MLDHFSYFIRQHVEKGIIREIHVHKHRQLTDIFTNNLKHN